MKNNKQNHNKTLVLNTLTLSMLIATTPIYALEILQDDDLRAVNGQDGVQISTTLSEANIDQLYWADEAGRGSAGATNNVLKATADKIKITKSNTSTVPLGVDMKLNTGSADTKVGLDLTVSASPALITIDSLRVCNNEATVACSPTLGNLAIQTTSNTDLSLRTLNGLFSKDSLSEMSLGIKNANIYLGQTDAKSQLNQLILKNFNFNFSGRGAIFVDSNEGLRMQTNTRTGTTDNVALIGSSPNDNLGYVDLNRVADSASKNTGFINTGSYGNSKTGAEGLTTSSGLNLEIMLNKGANISDPYALNPQTNSPNGAKGLIRLGASGRMVNSSLQFRGLKGQDSVLGNATSANNVATSNNVMGNSGIAFRMKTDFTKDNDSMLAGGGQATTLEIGGAGLNAYGFEFSNLTGLKPDTRASFDTGNVYLNLVDTKSLSLPVNSVFQASRFGNGSFLTSGADYTQNIHNLTLNNPYSVVAAIRGAEFQSIARRGRFTTSAGMSNASNLFADSGLKNEWGLALPFYNLNANLALYGTAVQADKAFYYTLSGSNVVKNLVASSGETSRLGFSVAMSTEGVDKDSTGKAQGDKTTSILVIDGGKVGTTNTTTDYYMGLRNIDMLLKGAGNIGVENGSLNVSLRDMLIVMSAEVAAGYLPGTTYKTCKLNSGAAGCASGGAASVKNFALPDDVLFGLKLRVGGDVDFSLIPNNDVDDGSRLSVAGEIDLKGAGNTIQISDPQNGSTLGLDNLTGKVGFNNAIVVAKDQGSGLGKVGFHSSFLFNPDKTTTGVLRAKDINFYPPNTGPGARLGELAITGGRLSTELSIIPRN